MLRSLRFFLLALCLAPAALRAQEPSIQILEDLDYGILLVAPQGGMIALSELGVLVATGPGVQPRQGVAAHAARFQLQGKPGSPFTLRLDPPTPFLAGPQGARIALDTYYCLPQELKGVFDGEGKAEFRLGGRLDLRADLPSGAFLAPLRLQLQGQGTRGPASAWQAFQAKVRLQGSFHLSCLQALDFGSLLPGSVPGVFTVSADGGSGSDTPGGPILAKGTPRPALFLLQGHTGSGYSIQVPRQITLTGPGRAIVVRDFSLNTPAQGVLPHGGKPFALGGRIVVPPNQETGAYHGVLQVTVAYP